MTKSSNKLTININPLSINKAFQGRRFMTKEHKQWREYFSLIVQKGYNEFYILGLDFYIKNFNGADLSNFIKITEDALVENGITADDRYTTQMFVRKFKVDNKEDEKIVVRFIQSIDEILNI